MEFLLICLVSFLGSGLTLFSGFGLGTILLPVFAVFFPLDVAIALTAIVHFLNNIFKTILLGGKADRGVVLRFGIPSVIAAFAGAYCLSLLVNMPPVYQYSVSSNQFIVTPVKMVIGLLLMFFALMEIVPRLNALQFHKKWLPLGGLLSGFFGGLSGNQGALRTAFLIRSGLTKETFIATGVVIACMVDVSRLTVYSGNILDHRHELNYKLVAAAAIAAFAGAFIGSRLVKKITVKALQWFVAAMLFIFSVLLMMGVI